PPDPQPDQVERAPDGSPGLVRHQGGTAAERSRRLWNRPQALRDPLRGHTGSRSIGLEVVRAGGAADAGPVFPRGTRRGDRGARQARRGVLEWAVGRTDPIAATAP